MTVPLLETERLILRGHQASDLDACLTMWSNPEVTRYIGKKPSSREEVWARLLRYVGHWALMDYGYWAIEEKSSGRFVGEAGMADLKRELEPNLNGAPEIGWALIPSVHRQGFATEAVTAVLEWARTRFGATRTVCLIDPENLASIRIAEKFGYREYARTTYKGGPTILFER